ncbi:MAG: hypothetical protein AAB354_13160 [candidate division KSB1 bacterium]
MKPSPRTETNLATPSAVARHAQTHSGQTLPVFRPKRRTDILSLSLAWPAPKPTWPRMRTSLGIALIVHLVLLLAVVLWPRPETQVGEVLAEIQFEDESETNLPLATPQSIAPAKPRTSTVAPPTQRAETLRAERNASPEKLAHTLQQTNPNAGGAGLSENETFDLPGKIGALNPNRPPARGAGSRSRAGAFGGGAQITLDRKVAREEEAFEPLGDFAASSIAAASVFRNRIGAPGNGLGQNKAGVGIDLGRGTGAGYNEGEVRGGLSGMQGGGPALGGGGYGARAGRGSGNGRGNGIGNGTEIGIASSLVDASSAMNLHDLMVWMKAHPGALPKLVQYDMEHSAADLAAAVSFSMNGKQYELFLSCNEVDLLLRICLIEGDKFTLLKDHGIKAASTYLAMGEVVRAGVEIQSLITSRQAPGETAQHFYKIFSAWWEGARR